MDYLYVLLALSQDEFYLVKKGSKTCRVLSKFRNFLLVVIVLIRKVLIDVTT